MKKLYSIIIILTLCYPAISQVIPNDPLFSRQLSLHSYDSGLVSVEISSSSRRAYTYNVRPGSLTGMPEAWSVTTGSRDIIVAVMEGGFFYNHEDLIDNVWVNAGETGPDENGIDKSENRRDDDNNGYIDDIHGYDFAFRDPDPDNISYDGKNLYRLQPFTHGTSVAGIIGAKGNNGIGVCGIAWDVSLMLLKPYNASLAVAENDTMKAFRYAEAIYYAVDNGARVINWSGTLSGDTTEYSRRKIINAFQYAYEKNVLIVLAVGSRRENLDNPDFSDIPACLEFPNVIKVTELDFLGDLYNYVLPNGDTLGSSYGINSVDVGAIGTNFSTSEYHGLPTYLMFGGTSGSAPVISGIAALMLSINPDLTPEEIKKIMVEESDKNEFLKGKIRSEGVINPYRSVLRAKMKTDK